MDKPNRPVYPNVRCELPWHPDEPGYVVCGHVLAGNLVFTVIPATPTRLGQILCETGIHDQTTGDTARPICAACARAKGWIADETSF